MTADVRWYSGWGALIESRARTAMSDPYYMTQSINYDWIAMDYTWNIVSATETVASYLVRTRYIPPPPPPPIVSVPEPSIAILMTSGLIAFGLVRRKTKV